MDDNARPHRSRAVTAYLQSEAVTSVPWPAHERYTPKPLQSLHRKGQLARCSLGHRLYLSVSKPSSCHWLHEAETGSRLTNGSCAMSYVKPCLFWLPNRRLSTRTVRNRLKSAGLEVKESNYEKVIICGMSYKFTMFSRA
jgi:hypothetical protein